MWSIVPRATAISPTAPSPWSACAASGLNICLGTDSLASTRTLSLFTEMQAVCDDFPSISPREALEMATVNAARALGRPGSSAASSRAPVRISSACPWRPPGENVYEEIVWNRRPVEWLMVDGQVRAA